MKNIASIFMPNTCHVEHNCFPDSSVSLAEHAVGLPDIFSVERRKFCKKSLYRLSLIC